jgi:AAA+ superfamily predicted ATPase
VSAISTAGLVVLSIIGVAILLFAGAALFERWFGSATIARRLSDGLGKDYQKLEVHEKTFPNFDVASVRRALDSFLEDCARVEEVGATPETHLRNLFSLVQMSPQLKPVAHSFERVPIDVGEEASFAMNTLWIAMTEEGDRIAILMAIGVMHGGYYDFDATHAPPMQITVTIACRSRAIADHFYEVIERRRRELSIYRGKIIDPVVDGGGIRSIRFRAIKDVADESLVLSGQVRELVDTSIIRFYENSEILDALGIEKKRGILLHGLPGTGKTSLCASLAKRLERFTICFVSGEQLLYPRELCRMARYLQPTMIVFEDIDLIAEQRDTNGLATILGELMNQIDGCEVHEEVLFVMNTNSLNRLESAVKNRPGRVDQIIELPLPDADQRRRLIEMFAAKVKLEVADWDKVESATRGATPAMVKEIVKRAIVCAIGDRPPVNGARVVIDQGGLLLAAEQVRLLRDKGQLGKAGAIGFDQES